MASFLFKWPHPEATEVYVTGTFDDWGKTIKLDKVGETWEKEVDLPSSDTKYLYKFVVNGEWVTDHTAPKEDDGQHNVNNVLIPDHIAKKPASNPGAAMLSSAAPGSTTAGLAAQQPIESASSAPPGAFPETPMNEPASFGVQPIPASSGVGNPKPGDVQTNTVDSAVTTSKEDYEKAGSAPEAPEPQSVSVNPIPASSGMGNPKADDVQAKSIQDTVTTAKEDYEKAGSSTMPIIGGAAAAVTAGAGAVAAFVTGKSDEKKNIIPESSLPMGENAGQTLNAGPAIQSSGPSSTTAGLAAGVPLEQKRQAMVVDSDQTPAADVPETVKESIAESHQSPEAAASEEMVKDKAVMEDELTSKVKPDESAGKPAPTAAAVPSETAPAPTDASPALAGRTPGQSAAPAAAIADGAGEEDTVDGPKRTVPAEKTEADATEYAPPHDKGIAPGVSPGAAAALSDGTEDPTLADEPAVRMMNQNEVGTAPTKAAEESKSDVPAAAATSTEAPKSGTATTETPKKETTAATAPTSAASKPTEPSSTTSTPSKEKKKKNRVSAFFKKIFD